MIREAQMLFDELVVAIGVNPDKRFTYTLDERKGYVARDYLTGNVRIASFENQYLVNYADSIHAEYIVRGIRTTADYEYERSMRYINSDLQPEISTVFLLPPREFAGIVYHGQRHGWAEKLARND